MYTAILGQTTYYALLVQAYVQHLVTTTFN